MPIFKDEERGEEDERGWRIQNCIERRSANIHIFLFFVVFVVELQKIC